MIDAVIQAAAFLALALVVELIAPLGRVSWKSRLIGLQLTLAKALGAALLIPVLYRGWSALGVQPIDVGVGFGDSIIGAIIGVSFAVLTSDFLGYWHHRFMHRFFWPVHATHHAIRELSALNAYAHFAEKITQFLIMVIPLSVIQWDSPVVPPAIILAVTWSEYWIHSPTTAQLNGLRGIFVTPRFHRIHHSLEPQHFDKNFGILFSFWDVCSAAPSTQPRTSGPRPVWPITKKRVRLLTILFIRCDSGELPTLTADIEMSEMGRKPTLLPCR